MNTRSRWLVVAVLVIAASLAVVNATVFAYRQLSGTLKVVESTGLGSASDAAKLGAACTGFYIKGTTSDDTIFDNVLPDGGKNHENQVNNDNNNPLGVKVKLSEPACSWQSTTDSSKDNVLYATAEVSLNVTNGTWYAKDIIAFGYPQLDTSVQPSSVYVWPKVKQTIDTTTYTQIQAAYLQIYKDGSLVMKVDLTTGNIVYGSSYIELNPGAGFQIDLNVTSSGSVSDVPFKIGFYVSTSTEAPR